MLSHERCRLQVGDIVHLNSGSPELTITAIDSGSAKVEWLDGGVTKQGVFPCACLKPVRQKIHAE